MRYWRLICSTQRSISLHLLFTVNLVLGVLLCGLLTLQYERDMRHAVSEKRASLKDEAIAVHAAISHLTDEHNIVAVQNYIDTVTREMRSAWSPHHHITIDMKNVKLTGSSEQCDKCIRSLPVNSECPAPSELGTDEYISGKHAENGVAVKVEETIDNIRESARQEVILRTVVLGGLGLFTALMVNGILLRIVGNPIKRLLHTVQQISDGKFGVEAPTFDTWEMQQLAAGINSMSQKLADNSRQQQLQMLKARQIQRHLLPNGVDIPGLQSACIFEPAEDVAGDYFDFLPLPDGRWLICLADVMGHGVPAAMGAALLKALLVAESEKSSFDLLSAMTRINRRFETSILPGTFASMFLASWNPSTGELAYANAGHEPTVLMRATGETEMLESTGTLLGIDASMSWDAHKVRLTESDRLLMFSDGAKEVHDARGKIFGMKRLSRILADNAKQDTDLAIEGIFQEIESHRGQAPRLDDLTLVLLACTIPLKPLRPTLKEQTHSN
ncbi:Phosphoserine phosphatase RsbU [Polystyrenella longa]|uniref:Phosphoserine phosphatase RsbU n=1 Tax=Polystyrenella longa TaxID=2528007 RepID=A0A518CSZ4_9PLAN|nr:SpoIIE family protein phosphatase [Polystyrenella longa]QDU82349.1 Phosphoserine phosphatase RsbU [Polystyrenella longa]